MSLLTGVISVKIWQFLPSILLLTLYRWNSGNNVVTSAHLQKSSQSLNLFLIGATCFLYSIFLIPLLLKIMIIINYNNKVVTSAFLQKSQRLLPFIPVTLTPSVILPSLFSTCFLCSNFLKSLLLLLLLLLKVDKSSGALGKQNTQATNFCCRYLQ